MGSDALIIEARLALINWEKYAKIEPSDELVYQANKMAKVLKQLIEEKKDE